VKRGLVDEFELRCRAPTSVSIKLGGMKSQGLIFLQPLRLETGISVSFLVS
jgi:hypothetical protein